MAHDHRARAYDHDDWRDNAKEKARRTDTSPEQPLSRLFSELARDASQLVRKEVELARTEMSEKIGEATSGVVNMAIGGGIAFAGLLFLLLAATYGLSEVMPPWLAALVVGLVVTAIGAALLMAGRSKLKSQNLQPNRTMATLREDGRWARQQLGR